MARARLTSKGQVTIPKEVRDRLGVGQGDILEFAFEGNRVEVRPIRRQQLAEFRGLFPIEEARDFAEERARARAARAARVVESISADDA
jgi:AbrB family looped-hinge helix DNA binding protein